MKIKIEESKELNSDLVKQISECKDDELDLSGSKLSADQVK